MWILHGYLGRELLKAFGMTTLALTVLLVMGGGVANVIRGEGIGAEQMVQVFLYFSPVAFTLILPIAALFSSTITYGRAAADNEILACRAAGINIHRLLFVATALGVLITVFTYFSWNFMLPGLQRRVEETTRRDLPALILGQLQKAKPLSYGDFKIMANQCDTVAREELPEDMRQDHTVLRLLAVSFMVLDKQELSQLGTADQAIIDIDNSGNSPKVTADMQGVRTFDVRHRQYFELEHQILGPREIPLPIKRPIKFENLPTLRRYADKPEEIPEIESLLVGMRRQMMTYFLNKDLFEEVKRTNGHYVFVDRQHRIELDVVGGMNEDEDDGRVTLRDVRARVSFTNGQPTQVYASETASVELRVADLRRNKPVIIIELFGNVQISREPAEADNRVVKKPKETLPSVAFTDQKGLMKRYESFDFRNLYRPDPGIQLFRKQQALQKTLVERAAKFTSEVAGEIHFRAAYSASTIAIVLIGALLGIIVRGGQALTAFGISCVPMVFVIVAMVVGRNLVDRPGYQSTSIAIMWGSTVFMYASAAFLGLKVLKR